MVVKVVNVVKIIKMGNDVENIRGEGDDFWEGIELLEFMMIRCGWLLVFFIVGDDVMCLVDEDLY